MRANTRSTLERGSAQDRSESPGFSSWRGVDADYGDRAIGTSSYSDYEARVRRRAIPERHDHISRNPSSRRASREEGDSSSSTATKINVASAQLRGSSSRERQNVPNSLGRFREWSNYATGKRSQDVANGLRLKTSSTGPCSIQFISANARIEWTYVLRKIFTFRG